MAREYGPAAVAEQGRKAAGRCDSGGKARRLALLCMSGARTPAWMTIGAASLPGPDPDLAAGVAPAGGSSAGRSGGTIGTSHGTRGGAGSGKR